MDKEEKPKVTQEGLDKRLRLVVASTAMGGTIWGINALLTGMGTITSEIQTVCVDFSRIFAALSSFMGIEAICYYLRIKDYLAKTGKRE